MAQRRRRMKAVEQLIPGVTHDGLTALWERHGLGTIATIAPMAGGGVNPMLLVNDACVLRFNRRDPHLPKLAWEASLYRRMSQSSVSVCPQVLALDTARDLVPYDVLVLSYIAGVAADGVWPQLRAAVQEELSEELGRICGAIHSMPWNSYGEYVTLPQDSLQSARWADIVFDKFRRMYAQATALDLLPLPLLDALITTLSDGDAVLESAAAPALTHTDLQLSNVLLRQEQDRWRIVGVIDWEWALVADPIWEFAELWSSPDDLYPLPDAFLYGYKQRHPLPLDFRIRQRLYRLVHHFEMLLVCTRHWPDAPQSIQYHRAAIDRLLKLR